MNEDEPETLDEYLAVILPLVDQKLAEERIGVRQRPFHAAITFVVEFILEVTVNGKSKVPRLDDGGFVAEASFGRLYQPIEEWYRKRYGAALDEPSSRREATGFLVMWATPFLIKVPTAKVSPGKPGKTIVLHYFASSSEFVGEPGDPRCVSH